jgi:ABC-2 type transport system ATP-binding protein
MYYIRFMFLKIENVSKNFDQKAALKNVSIQIEEGKIYGLLGPNGAGKTTLIRIITQIFYPDAGEVTIFGEKLNKQHLNFVGYMPEERGLYKKMKVGEQLLYFAKLRNFDKKTAQEKITFYAKKFEIESWLEKEISDLSKGMQQKVQFIATILHQPKLLILDEPFSGLDPINSEIIKAAIFELNKNGTTIIFSTHRMENVEEICNDIILINQGSIILDGKVPEIKQRFKKNIFQLKTLNPISQNLILDGVQFETISENSIHIILNENQNITSILKVLLDKNIDIIGVQEILPSVHEIFIAQVNQSKSN